MFVIVFSQGILLLFNLLPIHRLLCKHLTLLQSQRPKTKSVQISDAAIYQESSLKLSYFPKQIFDTTSLLSHLISDDISSKKTAGDYDTLILL